MKKKEYKITFGDTDYNIPSFGYRSSAFIILTSTLIIFLIPSWFEILFKGIKWPGLIVSSLMIGFVFGYGQFFLQSKKGFCRPFWIVSIILSIFVFVILFIASYTKTIL